MYYDNKSSFYVKQYGPKTLLVIFCILLICSGLYIYSASSNNTVTKKMIATETTENETISLKEDTTIQVNEDIKEVINIKNDTVSTVLNDELKHLKTLDKSTTGKVDLIKSDAKIVVKIGDKSYEISLIGVDYSKSPSNLVEIMTNDLKGKDINIAFDKLKVNDSNIYAYIYINGNLYNKEILKNGLAILKVERTNTALLDELLASQLYARSNSIGIWSKK